MPGGPHGLQNRWDPDEGSGGFDSHPSPPIRRRAAAAAMPWRLARAMAAAAPPLETISLPIGEAGGAVLAGPLHAARRPAGLRRRRDGRLRGGGAGPLDGHRSRDGRAGGPRRGRPRSGGGDRDRCAGAAWHRGRRPVRVDHARGHLDPRAVRARTARPPPRRGLPEGREGAALGHRGHPRGPGAGRESRAGRAPRTPAAARHRPGHRGRARHLRPSRRGPGARRPRPAPAGAHRLGAAERPARRPVSRTGVRCWPPPSRRPARPTSWSCAARPRRAPPTTCARSCATAGAELLVESVACRPGHPQLLARLTDRRLVVGLPGNPYAALVAALTLLVPALGAMTGRAGGHGEWAKLDARVTAHPADTRIVAVRRAGARMVPVGHDRPGLLRGAALADALAVVPPRWRGEEVELLGLPF